MNDCFVLALKEHGEQSANDDSFVGGIPKIPVIEPIPRCTICGAEESFFFQVAFSKGSAWDGTTLAIFACTSCADEQHLIPAMLTGPLPGASIPAGFLDSYQTNFKFLLFPTVSGTPRTNYRERVKFRKFLPYKSDNAEIDVSKVGGTPVWLQGDESPRSYAHQIPMFFLMQLSAAFEFQIHDSAPRQIELGLTGKQKPSRMNYYRLFNGNKLFFFGTADREIHSVYIITQVD